MIYNRYGQHFGNKSSDTSVSIVGLGCSSFSSFFLDDSVTPHFERYSPLVQGWIDTIIFAVTQSKINLLDTAPWYGDRSSETVIGWAMEEILVPTGTSSTPTAPSTTSTSISGGLQPTSLQLQNKTADIDMRIDRASLFINTKVGRYKPDPKLQFDFSRETTLESVQRSLERLKCGYIDVLQLHDPEFSPSLELLLEETIPAMLECKAKGWCRAIGMTGYPLQVQHQILQASLDKFDRNVWDQAMTYCHFNLHDSSLVSQPLPKTGHSFAHYCREQGLDLVVAAPLSMGLLTHQGPPKWHPASQELKNACRVANDVLSQDFENASLSKIALHFALALAIEFDIPCTVLGMKDIDEIKYVTEVVNRLENCTSAIGSDENVAKAAASHLPGSSTTIQKILSATLQTNEYAGWERLQDTVQGPFAEVWKKGTYQWDGVYEVRRFWKKVPDVAVSSWQLET